MRKLTDLVEFIIKQCNFVAAENVDSFHIIDEFKPLGDFVDNGINTGVCLYDQTYSAVIRIERFPCQRYPPALVFGLVACWVLENDPIEYRNKIESDADNEPIPLPLIDINEEQESDETIALELIVPFREPVFGIEDSTGAFLFQGKHYRLADESKPAEQFEANYIMNRTWLMFLALQK